MALPCESLATDLTFDDVEPRPHSRSPLGVSEKRKPAPSCPPPIGPSPKSMLANWLREPETRMRSSGVTATELTNGVPHGKSFANASTPAGVNLATRTPDPDVTPASPSPSNVGSV